MESIFSRIIHGNEEQEHSPAYVFDNNRRTPAGLMVIQLTLEGYGFIKQDGERYLVGKDHAMLFVYGDKSRYGYPPEVTCPYRHRFLAFYGSAIQPAFRSLQDRFGPVLHMPPGSPSRRLFLSLSDLGGHSVICDRYDESAKLYELVMTLFRDQSERGQQADPAMALYELMHNRFQQAISLKEFAAEHRVSREYLSRKFKHQYGTGPASLLRLIRMNHARSLMESTTMPVTEVGRQCGYPDLNAFSRTYRKVFGRSPRDTRG